MVVIIPSCSPSMFDVSISASQFCFRCPLESCYTVQRKKQIGCITTVTRLVINTNYMLLLAPEALAKALWRCCVNTGESQWGRSPRDFVRAKTLFSPYQYIANACPIYKYVDDSTIFEICKQDMVSVIQDSADLVEQWPCNNDMRINTTKTKELVICFRRDRTFVDYLTYIYMTGNYIERVSQEKVLGVTISSDLGCNAHADEIMSKARKRVYMIYQLKRAGINQNDLIRIYVSVIRPVVEYACPLWHTNLPKYLSDNIEIIQKRCLKTIFLGYQYENILQMVNLPKMHRRRDELCISLK